MEYISFPSFFTTRNFTKAFFPERLTVRPFSSE